MRQARTTPSDNLYNTVPLNAQLNLRLGAWGGTAKLQLVSAGTRVWQVRNEVRTGGYGRQGTLGQGRVAAKF